MKRITGILVSLLFCISPCSAGVILSLSSTAPDLDSLTPGQSVTFQVSLSGLDSGGMIDELCRLEGETDRLETALVRELFRIEEELSAVTVMLWYRIIGWIGNMADHAERAGNRLRLLIAR